MVSVAIKTRIISWVFCTHSFHCLFKQHLYKISYFQCMFDQYLCCIFHRSYEVLHCVFSSGRSCRQPGGISHTLDMVSYLHGMPGATSGDLVLRRMRCKSETFQDMVYKHFPRHHFCGSVIANIRLISRRNLLKYFCHHLLTPVSS